MVMYTYNYILNILLFQSYSELGQVSKQRTFGNRW